MHFDRHVLTPARALLLAALLLLAQAAGLAHRVAHGGAPPADAHWVGLAGPGHGHAHADARADPRDHRHAHGHGHGIGITQHEQAGAECRLFDQLLGHADLLPAASVSCATPAAGAMPAASQPASAASSLAAAYQARAPPKT